MTVHPDSATESARPSLAARVKYRVARAVKRNPYTWAAIWNVLPYCRFMLPHDRSYFGFRHLATGDEGLFLDIGANNGMSAAGFRILNDRYAILSIEANELHAPSLERLKRRLPRFDFKILAAGRERGSLEFVTPSFRGIALHAFTSTNRHFLDLALERDFSPFVRQRLDYIDHRAAVAPGRTSTRSKCWTKSSALRPIARVSATRWSAGCSAA